MFTAAHLTCSVFSYSLVIGKASSPMEGIFSVSIFNLSLENKFECSHIGLCPSVWRMS